MPDVIKPDSFGIENDLIIYFSIVPKPCHVLSFSQVDLRTLWCHHNFKAHAENDRAAKLE